jgi:chorismate dehydratase
MSSFYFLKNGTLNLIEGISISSDGAVASVMLYSKKPLKDLDGANVTVPVCSATSINLMLVLLKEIFSVVPILRYAEKPDVNDPSVDAALVIGDQALRAEENWTNRFVKADLGEWWRIVTGLPMVFGLWAAQPDWVAANERSFEAISQALRQACATGLGAQFEAVVQEGCARTGMPERRIQQYFLRDLNYKMTSRHEQGLALYGELCEKHGLFKEETAQ